MTVKINSHKIVWREEFVPSSRVALAMSGTQQKLVVDTVLREKRVLFRAIILVMFGMWLQLAAETLALSIAPAAL
jgi:hypothetical protein